MESTYATILDPDDNTVTQSRMPHKEVSDFLRPPIVEKLAALAVDDARVRLHCFLRICGCARVELG